MSEGDIETSTMRMPWSTGGCSTMNKKFLVAIATSCPIQWANRRLHKYMRMANRNVSALSITPIEGYIRKQEAPTNGQKLQKFLRITPGYHLCFVRRNVSRYYHKYLFSPPVLYLVLTIFMFVLTIFIFVDM